MSYSRNVVGSKSCAIFNTQIACGAISTSRQSKCYKVKTIAFNDSESTPPWIKSGMTIGSEKAATPPYRGTSAYHDAAGAPLRIQIGSASCRERVCTYV